MLFKNKVISDNRLSRGEESLLKEQVGQLLVDGWSQEAIDRIYRAKVIKKPKALRTSAYFDRCLKQARTFGSPLFISLWHYEAKRANCRKAQRLLKLALTYIDLPLELSGGPEEARRLISRFSDDLRPDSRFWRYFAATVKKAYPKETFLKEDEQLALKRQIHQFRYVISAQQAQWVRRHYRHPGWTDGQALAHYLSQLPSSLVILRRLLRRRPAYQLKVSSRLHNKLALLSNGEVLYPDGEKRYNFKVLIGFHTEFILSDQGAFLNELDPEGSSLAAIINGASFNYAGLSFKDHKILDVRPVKPYDPEFRSRLSSQKGRRYRNPDRKTYTDRADQIYGDGQQSLQDHVKGVVRTFKDLIRASRKG